MPSPAEQSIDPSPYRNVVRAVERASSFHRDPVKCLPRAMVVQWMLRRRGLASTLVFGVGEAAAGGSVRDLHAWITAAGVVVIGATATPHAAAFALKSGGAPQPVAAVPGQRGG